jgi:hypothetical protein
MLNEEGSKAKRGISCAQFSSRPSRGLSQSLLWQAPNERQPRQPPQYRNTAQQQCRKLCLSIGVTGGGTTIDGTIIGLTGTTAGPITGLTATMDDVTIVTPITVVGITAHASVSM